MPGSILTNFFRTLAVPLVKISRVELAFCSLLLALPCSAQVALKSDTPSILFWTQEQQSAGYRSIEKIYKVATVKRGSKVHPLPKASKQLSPTLSTNP